MGLKIASLSKLACCLAIILTPTVKCQTPSCNIREIDIGLCLNQSDGSFSINHSCCEMLNQAVQIGYSCLCLLAAAASFPLPIPPLTLPLSNCSISVPPLSLCQVIAPLPGGLIPSSPDDEIVQTSPPPIDLPLSSPPSAREVRDHSNTTGDGKKSPVEETQPPSSAVVPKLHLPNRQKSNGTANSGTRRCMATKTTLWRRIWFLICIFLVVLLHFH